MVEENEMIRRLEAGDEEAFKDFYRHSWADLYRIAVRIIGDNFAAEDVVQNIFFDLYKTRSNFSKVHTSLKGWMYAAVKGESIRYLNKKAASQQANYEHLNANSGTDPDLAQYQELLDDAVQTLTPRQAEIFRLAKFEQLPHVQIAENLNISVQTVKNTLGTASDKIEKALAAHISGDSPAS